MILHWKIACIPNMSGIYLFGLLYLMGFAALGFARNRRNKTTATSAASLLIPGTHLEMTIHDAGECKIPKSYLKCMSTTIHAVSRGTATVSAVCNLTRTAQHFTKLSIEFTKCQDVVSSNTCEHFQTWTWTNNVEKVVFDPHSLWAPFVYTLIPPVTKMPFPATTASTGPSILVPNTHLELRLEEAWSCKDMKSDLKCISVAFNAVGRGATTVSAICNVTKTAQHWTKMIMDFTKCRDVVSANTCEHFQTMTWTSNVENVIFDRHSFWAPFIYSVNPPMTKMPVYAQTPTQVSASSFTSHEQATQQQQQQQQQQQISPRRRLGQNNYIRSPMIKRPVGAPVTHQGWLHKQGSEGFMLWKKRWFVLCEYCLFYYKGPEEGKLLGSILLPSYNISLCSPGQDRVYRKFSFKAEHVNMRTFYFAAESHESMVKWIHVLRLASLLMDRTPAQERYEEPRHMMPMINQKHSPGEESDAGFTTCRPRIAATSGQIHQTLSSGSEGGMNGWQPSVLHMSQLAELGLDERAYHQHLYANAPPKPRRLANEDLGSSSDQSPERLGLNSTQTLQAIINYPGPQVQSRLVMSPNNAERRTPDTYGRPPGTVGTPGVVNIPHRAARDPADYEDVYGGGGGGGRTSQNWLNSYQGPGRLARLQATAPGTATIVTSNYEATYHDRNNTRDVISPTPAPQVVTRRMDRKPVPPRPHSADFLEYDARRHEEDQGESVEQTQMAVRVQPPRPKSSLDLYWSEEGYAEKMRARQSAYLLSPTHNGPRASTITQPSVARVLSPSAELLRDSEQQHILQMQRRQNELLQEQMHLQQELDYQKKQNQQEKQQLILQRQEAVEHQKLLDYQKISQLDQTTRRKDTQLDQQQQQQQQQQQILEQQQQIMYHSDLQSPGSPGSLTSSDQPFLRSASARLPRSRTLMSEGSGVMKSSGSGILNQRRLSGDRAEREESMQRLLEWKQRMLQSPLARKSSGSTKHGINSAQNQLSNYKQQALRELEDQERRARGLVSHDSQDPLDDLEVRERLLGSDGMVRETDLLGEEVSPGWNSSSREFLNVRSSPYDSTRNMRRRSQEETGRINIRSRSQDGRRSSASNRYTSYSSDDEVGEVREARKRVRRPSQTNRSRRNSTEEKNALLDTTPANSSGISGYSYYKDSVHHIAMHDDRFSVGKYSDSGYDTLQPGVLNPETAATLMLKSRDNDHDSIVKSSMYNSINQRVPSTVKNQQNCVITRLDEDAIVKQFSCQYLRNEVVDHSHKPHSIEESKRSLRKVVDSRVKVYEDQSTSGQESDHQMRTRSMMREFAFGQEKKSPENRPPSAEIVRHPKSVKDLLADFERKSKFAQDQQGSDYDRRSSGEPNRRSGGNKYDNTSAHDISSDLDGSEAMRSSDCLSERSTERLDAEDGEVAATLGNWNQLVSGCRDDGDTTAKIVAAPQVPSKQPVDCSTPVADGKKSEVDEQQQEDCQSVVTEEHYMSMTPSKKMQSYTLFSERTSVSRSLAMENIYGSEMEESSYVEMTTGGLAKSLLAPDPNNSSFSSNRSLKSNSSSLARPPEGMQYFEMAQSQGSNSHYELMYRVGANEPLYMEVSPMSDLLQGLSTEKQEPSELVISHNRQYSNCSAHRAITTPDKIHGSDSQLNTPLPRLSRPDILDTSPLLFPQQKSSLKSDSSDADDEASKDLDSLDTPRHPRFSLSDTFRPASYYLGASSGVTCLSSTTAEQHDSSDSDLVSPPPIPTSPPPLDDLDTSLELNDSSLDLKKLSPSHSKTGSVSSRKENNSSFDGGSVVWNQRTDSIQGDVISLQSPGHSSNNSRLEDSISDSVEFRNSADMMKRRPVSDELIDRLDDPEYVGGRSFLHSSHQRPAVSNGRRCDIAIDIEESDSVDLDRYLGNLHCNSDGVSKTVDGYYNTYQKEMYRTTENPGKPGTGSKGSTTTTTTSRKLLPLPPSGSSPTVDFQPPPVREGRKASLQQESEVLYENLQLSFPPPPPPEILNDFTNGSAASPVTSAAEPPPSGAAPAGPSPGKESNSSQGGAPYYYSDLLKGSELEGLVISASDKNASRPTGRGAPFTQLNNQRGDLHDNKRNDVGRKVNPIPGPAMPTMQESRLLAEEIRTTSVSFLGADKSGLVDQRNIYDSDTLRRGRANTMGSSSRGGNNLYPQSPAPLSPDSQADSIRRSRSLEGLLDEPDLLEGSHMINRLLQANKLESMSPERTTSTSGDIWAEDSLWRESLRRVSLRHTRSLDNLDGPSSAPGPQASPVRPGTTPRPPQAGGARLSREVTYVNDLPNGRRPAPDYEDYRESARRNAQSRIAAPPAPIDDRDDGVHYERLSRFSSESLERTRRGQTYLDGYVWDEDRETFRPGASRQQQQQQSFLEQRPPLAKQPPASAGAGSPVTQPGPLTPITTPQAGLHPLLQTGQIGPNTPQGGTQSTQGGPHTPQVGPPTPQKEAVSSQEAQTADGLPGSTERLRYQRHQHKQGSVAGSLGGRLDSRSLSARSLSRSRLAPGRQLEISTRSLTGRDSAQNPLFHPNLETQGRIFDSDPGVVSPDGYMALGGSQILGPDDTYAMDEVRRACQQLRRSQEMREAKEQEALEFQQALAAQQQQQQQQQVVLTGSMKQRGSKKQGEGQGRVMPLDVSAGDLLVHTHGELVLLLISLRRTSANICKSMEICHAEIEAETRLAELDVPKRNHRLQRLEELRKELLDLEKEYEKGKPLVNLVDNMVKLGTLYHGTPSMDGSEVGPYTGSMRDLRERREFNHRVQEQRLLAEERRDWDRLSPDQGQLQAKVHLLYDLDRLMEEESNTLQMLQHNKELLERTLATLRYKIGSPHFTSADKESFRRKQQLLERELSRVLLLLASHSRKLEETVTENALLEQELVILRQKMQSEQRTHSSQSSQLGHLGQRAFSSESLPLAMPLSSRPAPRPSSPDSERLEAELARARLIVGDVDRQRDDLGAAVRQLTEKSDSARPGPSGIAGADPLPSKKRQHSCWLETDLDSLVTQDVGNNDSQHISQTSIITTSSVTSPSSTTAPLYVNTELDQRQESSGSADSIGDNTADTTLQMSSDNRESTTYGQMELSEADDRMKRFYGIIPREKQQEIKTVRIVKRESERRQRDRDRSGAIGIPLLGSSNKRSTLAEESGDSCGLDRNQSTLGLLSEAEESFTLTTYPVDATVQSKDGDLPGMGGNNPTAWMDETASSQALDEAMAQLDNELELGPEDSFQRSRSLPRGFGKTNAMGIEVEAVPSSDRYGRLRQMSTPSPSSESNLRSAVMRRQKVRFDAHSGSGSESNTSSPSGSRTLSAREQLFGTAADEHLSTGYSMLGLTSRETSPQLSPIYTNHAAYQSEAARQIVMEMNACSPSVMHQQKMQQPPQQQEPRHQKQQEQQQQLQQTQGAMRRQVPRERRRHHTVSGRGLAHNNGAGFPAMSARSRDDMDMERALRPRLNGAPDLVRSTLSRRTQKYDADTIDSLLGTPGKIHIPERYVPESEPTLSQEERLKRLRKADAIRKMLSETHSSTTLPSTPGEGEEEEKETETLKKKSEEDKRDRERLLVLNQLLATQVMERSKVVAENALAELPLQTSEATPSDDESPEQPLPLYQQRENFYS